MRRRGLLQLAPFLFAVLAAGCVERSAPFDAGVTPPEITCTDNDGDGYGVACEAGLDCDDSDPTIHADCNPDLPCITPRAGCECDEEGAEVVCRTSEPVVSDDGSSLCYVGHRVCEDGVWGPCRNMTSYDPIAEIEGGDDGSGSQRSAILGHPRPCEESCDSGCRSIYDCPSDTDFTPDDAIGDDNPDNAPGLRYDLELTVGSGEDAVTYPPATVLDDGFTEGFFYRSFSMTCPQDMMAIWWALDFDLNFPEPNDSIGIDIDVRTAAFADELPDDPASEDGPAWVSVVRCPATRADAQCTRPEHPNDREMFPDSGNLYQALGEEAARHQFVQMRVRLWRANASLPSPRLGHTEVFFFCGEAS